jgi:serine/tyrosine/threonine adenylyltransferase
LLPLLTESKADYTSFFRVLRHLRHGETPIGFDEWTSRWRELSPDVESMDRANPIYIPRNHLVEEALTAATAGDLDPLERLLVAVTDPYHERAGLERYASPAPEDFGPYQTFCGT